MNGRQGSTLVLLLLLTLVYFMLGTALFAVAFSDWRVSRHLEGAESAFYCAEAGVEAVLAALPREHEQVGVIIKQFVQAADPEFTATVAPVAGEDYTVRIEATGRSQEKSRTVEALARFRPFGLNCVVAETLDVEEALLEGGVLAGSMTVGSGETRVAGRLCLGAEPWLEGRLDCQVHRCEVDAPEIPRPDFEALQDAVAEWPEPVGEDGCYRFPSTPVTGCFYIPGNLLLEGEMIAEALLVVAGDVEIHALPAGSLVLLAAGEITLACGEQEWQDSELVAYSAGRITVREGGRLRGILMAPYVEMKEAAICFGDRAAMGFLDLIPRELLQVSPSFSVEWVDREIRR